MNTRNDIAERVKDTLAQTMELPRENVVMSAPLESLGIDSLDIVKLVARCEREFGVTFSTAELLNVATLDEIIHKISQKLAG